MENSHYRPDIDGLRAIAVLAVVLYHIDAAWLPGGFVGVDVFFVISGYLITLHLLRDLRAGRFSLTEFYRRRIRRIVPAMLLVVAVVLVAAQVLFAPADAEGVAQSAVASVLSLANVYFWLFANTEYFAPASEELPLLHLWSLGVEEQYYVLWPLLLWYFHRLGRDRFLAVFGVVALSSFVLGEWIYPIAPSFAYYMLPTRFGELMVGALVARMVLEAPVSPRWSARTVQIMEGAGALLLVGSLSLISRDDVFPGMRALAPTLGTALLILAGSSGHCVLCRWLARPLPVGIGLISYSMYLWHWPLLAFLRYANIPVDLPVGGAVLLVTVALSWLTWRFVEQPARRYRGSFLRTLSLQYALPGGALLAVALAIFVTDGYFLHPRAEQYRKLAVESRPAYEYPYVCQKWRIEEADVLSERCTLKVDEIVEAQGTVPARGEGKGLRILLWGDSNAAHYLGMVASFIGADGSGHRITNIEHSSCPPLLSDPAPYLTADLVADCRASLEVMWRHLDAFDVVVLASSYDTYLGRSEDFLDRFLETAEQLVKRGKRVLVLGQVPPVRGYDRRCREKAVGLPFLDCDTVLEAPVPERIATINRTLRERIAALPGAVYYDVVDVLCPEGRCRVLDSEGRAWYFDASHLSMPASWRLGRHILETRGLPEPLRWLLGRTATGAHAAAAGRHDGDALTRS